MSLSFNNDEENIGISQYFFGFFCLYSLADTVAVSVLELDKGLEARRPEFDAIINEAVTAANKWYGNYIQVVYEPGNEKADYQVSLQYKDLGTSTYLNIVTKKRGESSSRDDYYIREKISIKTAMFLANVIFYQWSSYHDYLSSQYRQFPLFVDEISTDYFARILLPQERSFVLSPLSVAVRKNGNVLASFGFYCVEFDRQFRIVSSPGRELFDEGNFSYAYNVYVTPGDTVYLKSSSGTELFRLVDGALKSEKIRVVYDMYGPFTVLADGSFVTINNTKKTAFRISGSKKTPLNLFTSETSTIQIIASGPEGNLWVYDSVEKRIRIYSPEGLMVDSIMPLLNPNFPASNSMVVLDDGSFILSGFGKLFKFDRKGAPIWATELVMSHPYRSGENIALHDPLPMFFYVDADNENGFIYLTDQMGKRILKFIDVEYCRSRKIVNEFEEKILALTDKQMLVPGDTLPLISKARLYQQVGALEMAISLWERVLERDAAYKEAQENIYSIEYVMLVNKAEEYKSKTLDVLYKIGPMSARALYETTMRMFESILSVYPDKDEVRRSMNELQVLYMKGTKALDDAVTLIKIESMDAVNLFPSLIHYYKQNPVGKVQIKNTLTKSITAVTASYFIKKYMDFPTEVEGAAEVKPGQELQLDLFAQLNSEVFTLQEDLPIQVNIVVKYLVDGQAFEIARSVNITLYRRSALTWDDTAKLASFITPNEEVISLFAHHILEGAENFAGLPQKFMQAMRIVSALGVYKSNYVEDPASPISQALGKSTYVDTVRFPRTTLLMRSGDCDDTAALLCSLFEAAGISTAIMTTPGHVFMAFNTEEPVSSLWMFATDQLEAFAYEGTIWIPLETTVLDKGFITAWIKASELVRNYRSQSKLEFLVAAKLRATFPPLPLPQSTFSIIEPAAGEITTVFGAARKTVSDSLYLSAIAFLQKEADKSSGREKLILQNKMGIVCARFGYYSQAEGVFKQCLTAEADFLPPYLNLANVYIVRGETEQAIVILKKALEFKPDSYPINLLTARCYYRLSKPAETAFYYEKARQANPAQAELFAYLVAKESGTGRAGVAEDETTFLWASE